MDTTSASQGCALNSVYTHVEVTCSSEPFATHRALPTFCRGETLRFGERVQGVALPLSTRSPNLPPGTAEIWCVGVVHSVRVQRWRPQCVRYLFRKTPLLRIGLVANRTVHGESQNA